MKQWARAAGSWANAVGLAVGELLGAGVGEVVGAPVGGLVENGGGVVSGL